MKRGKRNYQDADERTEDEIEPTQEDLLLRRADHIAHELLVGRVLVDFLLGVTNVTFEEVAVLLDGGADVALLFGGAHRSLSKGSFGGESGADTSALVLATIAEPLRSSDAIRMREGKQAVESVAKNSEADSVRLPQA